MNPNLIQTPRTDNLKRSFLADYRNNPVIRRIIDEHEQMEILLATQAVGTISQLCAEIECLQSVCNPSGVEDIKLCSNNGVKSFRELDKELTFAQTNWKAFDAIVNRALDEFEKIYPGYTNTGLVGTDGFISKISKELSEAKVKLAFLESKGITAGMVKTSNKPEGEMAYVIKDGFELDDKPILRRLDKAQARIKELENPKAGYVFLEGKSTGDEFASVDRIVTPNGDVLPLGKINFLLEPGAMSIINELLTAANRLTPTGTDGLEVCSAMGAKAYIAVDVDLLVRKFQEEIENLYQERAYLFDLIPTTAQVMVYHSLLKKYEALETELAILKASGNKLHPAVVTDLELLRKYSAFEGETMTQMVKRLATY